MTSAYDGPLSDQIEEWASKLVGPYLKRLPKNPFHEGKEIHDPVAGIVSLEPWEVYLLDSPLMQRLRYIRQLGVGHLLFPTSGYSRFEHSIGAISTATRMFEEVCGDSYGTRKTGANHGYNHEQLRARRDVLRIAAMMHDVGHCVFSHVSERFYAKHSDVGKAVSALSSYYETKVTAAESISILIVLSGAFKDLLEASLIRRSIYSEERIATLAAACIAGSKVRLAPDCFMAEIINGPVDCDKLDYLARDAHMAGVPISLDIPRLLSKLRLAQLEADDSTSLLSLAIVQSGTRALDELLVSRIFLFDKFYYHPKVMAAEELVRRALYHLSMAVPGLGSPTGLLAFGDDELLAATPQEFAARLPIKHTDTHLQRGCELLSRVRERRLPRRAFAFAARFLPEVPELLTRFETIGKTTPTAIGQYEYKRTIQGLESTESRERCAEELQNLAGELGSKTDVFVGIQSAGRAAGNMYLPVMLPDGSIEEKPSFLFKAGEWTEAYALNKQTQYVFADTDLARVYLAAERYFGERELCFAPNSCLVAKVNRSDVDGLRGDLKGEWLSYRLPQDYLSGGQGRKRITSLVQKFASFTKAVHSDLGDQLVDAWIAQFPDADTKESALRLLEHVTIVEADRLVGGFSNILHRNSSLREALWVPFRARGGKGKSADQLSYDIKELGVATMPSGTLSAAELSTYPRLVFFDDSLNSGVQATTLLRSWFGASAEGEPDRDRDPAGALDPALQEALKKVPIAFVFYAVHPRGREALLGEGKVLGLSIEGVSNQIDTDDASYNLKGLKCATDDSLSRLRNFMLQKGKELLLDKLVNKAPGWDTQRVSEYALGYGGLGLTVVFRHSISTATPVALWKACLDPGSPWLPLFPRKKSEISSRIDPARERDTHLPEYRG